jgi:hypothetical protein
MLAGVVYAIIFGLAEAGLAVVPVPSTQWQVPAVWFKGRGAGPTAILVWASLLGPGFLTRNLYATFWWPIFAIPWASSFGAALAMGVLIGGMHAASRAAGIIANQHRLSNPVEAILQHGIWKYIDGLVLLAAGSLSAGVLWAPS